MAATPQEMTLDLGEIDAEAAKKAESASKTATKEPDVVVEGAAKEAKEAAPALSPEEGIEKLRKQLKDEQDARAAAESRALEAARAEAEARGRVQTTELDLVKNAIATVTQANDALESRYAEAMAAQDWGTAAKLQRQMGDNSAKLAQLEAGKNQLEKQPKPTLRAHADIVEQYIQNIPAEYPRSRQWIREHPEFVRDQRKNAEMIAAHELAIARGYKADTDDYFKSIERTLDLPSQTSQNGRGNGRGNGHDIEADPTADVSATAATGGRQSAPAAAPVSRSAMGNGGSRQNVVRLTADEVEIAEHMGMTPEEYARNKVALKKEGKLS